MNLISSFTILSPKNSIYSENKFTFGNKISKHKLNNSISLLKLTSPLLSSKNNEHNNHNIFSKKTCNINTSLKERSFLSPDNCNNTANKQVTSLLSPVVNINLKLNYDINNKYSSINRNKNLSNNKTTIHKLNKLLTDFDNSDKYHKVNERKNMNHTNLNYKNIYNIQASNSNDIDNNKDLNNKYTNSILFNNKLKSSKNNKEIANNPNNQLSQSNILKIDISNSNNNEEKSMENNIDNEINSNINKKSMIINKINNIKSQFICKYNNNNNNSNSNINNNSNFNNTTSTKFYKKTMLSDNSNNIYINNSKTASLIKNILDINSTYRDNNISNTNMLPLRLSYQIFDYLYLGNHDNSKDIDNLLKNQISGILNCAIECQNYFPSKFEYKKIPVCDTSKTNIKFYLEEAADFIENIRLNNKKVLVHCYKGRSRSVTCIIAYMIKYKSMSYESAYVMIKNIKSDVNPNKGFINQLKEFEYEFKHKSNVKTTNNNNNTNNCKLIIEDNSISKANNKDNIYNKHLDRIDTQFLKLKFNNHKNVNYKTKSSYYKFSGDKKLNNVDNNYNKNN